MHTANAKLFAAVELMERGLNDRAHEMLSGLCEDFRRLRPLDYDQAKVDRIVSESLPGLRKAQA